VNQPMTPEQRRNAKAQVVATMNQGQSWQTAVAVQPLDMVDNSNRFYELISDGFYPIRLYR
jgi:hypothetical protein